MSPQHVGGAVYSLWSRELLDTITVLLGRVSKHLDFPKILQEGADISELWHAGAYQRQLREFVSRGGNLEEDMLLPLVFFSGLYCCICIWAASHDMYNVIDVFFSPCCLVRVLRALA